MKLVKPERMKSLHMCEHSDAAHSPSLCILQQATVYSTLRVCVLQDLPLGCRRMCTLWAGGMCSKISQPSDGSS